MEKCLDCSKKAMARCSNGKNCAKYGGHFIEGSRCHQFNKQVSLQPFTEADRIRAMNDEELTAAIYWLINATDPATWFCKGSKECGDLMDNDQDIPDEMCKKCLLAKLQEPAEEGLPCG